MNQIKSKQKCNLVISKNLASQIEVLHSQCPSDKEWSGLLVFKILEGSLDNPETLKILCDNLFLMDCGDSTFTSFEAGEDWLKFYEIFPHLDPIENPVTHPWYYGKIHSHHNMSAFHSGTDTQDLVDNAPKFPFFLSLVVNYKCQPFAEIAVAGEVTIQETRTLKNILLREPVTSKVEKYTLIIPCDVSYETDNWLEEQIKRIKDKSKPVVTTGYNSYYQQRILDHSYDEPIKSSSSSSINDTAPNYYKQVLGNLSELFCLGAGVSSTFKVAPALMISKINIVVNNIDLPKFKSAFKQHFLNWFDEHYAMKATEEEVMSCIIYFLKQETNKDKWISNIIILTLNELKTELNLLFKI